MLTMMNQLRNRILTMLKKGSIKDVKEKEKLEFDKDKEREHINFINLEMIT